MKNVLYLIQAISIYFFFFVCKIIGYKNSSNLGAFLGKKIGPFFRSKKILQSNLKKAFSNISEKEINKISRDMWENYGRILAEYVFIKKLSKEKIKKNLNFLLKNKNEILKSCSPSYKYKYSNKFLKKIKKKSLNLRVIGMGGSILGLKAISQFLSSKIKKKVNYIDNLNPDLKNYKDLKKPLNLVISKSGNTLETIANVNILVKKNHQNIFITQNSESYLKVLANKLKADVIDHNNFIGGRYSVLSEVGMLPSILLGLNEKKFKQLNNIVKNKNFLNSLITNTANIFFS